MRIALIANPVSGGRNRMIHWVEKKLDQQGISYDLFVSKSEAHLMDIGAGLEVEQYEAVVAMGGDGTNFQVLNGLLRVQPARALPPLGIIPAGSGNSFARDLNIRTIDQGIQAIVRNRPRPVDVCSFTQGGPPYTL